MTGKIKIKLISMLLIFLYMQAAAFVYAEGGEQASSPGIPGKKPLHVSGVTLSGGGDVSNAVDIPTEPQFIVLFDKNVVNSLVWANNSKCFSLVSTDHADIPLSVTKVDDTIDVSQRQNIFVQPAQPLSPGTAYYLKISPQLQAKNGVTLGEGVTITFRTKGEAPAQLPRPVQEKADSDGAAAAAAGAVTPQGPGSAENQKQQQVTAEQKPSGLTEQGVRDEDATPQETRGAFAGGLTTIAILLITGWIIFEIINKRKARK